MSTAKLAMMLTGAGMMLAGCVPGPISRTAEIIGTDAGLYRVATLEERGACRDKDLVIFDCVEVTQTVFVQAADGTSVGAEPERDAAFAAALRVCEQAEWTKLDSASAASGEFAADAWGFMSICS